MIEKQFLLLFSHPPFHIEFFYSLELQRYKVTGVATFAKEMEEKGLGKPKVSLQFELGTDGITNLIKAEAAVEETYTVQEEVEIEEEEEESESNSTEAEEGVERKTEETAEDTPTEEEAKGEEEAKEEGKEAEAEGAAETESKDNETKTEEEPKKKKTKMVEKVRIFLRCCCEFVGGSFTNFLDIWNS